MRKFFITAGIALMGLAAFIPSASAKSAETPFDLPNGYHVKTDICHNVDHNPVVVHVSINSADYPYDTGHGDLTLNGSIHFVSFAPHIGTGGHEHDFVLRVYIKHGNDEVNTYVSESKCESEETTTTTEAPTTTTTQPEVTTTTQPVVTTTQPPVVTTTQPPVVTTTAPPVVTTTAPPVTTTTQAPPATTVTTVAPPAAGTPAPGQPLPFTGANTDMLARFGLLALGLGTLTTGLVRKPATVRA